MNQLFEGVRPSGEFLQQPFYTQGSELRNGHEVPVDCSYVYGTNDCITTVRTSFDMVTLYWTDVGLIDNPDTPGRPLQPYRYLAARYVAPNNRAWRYELAQTYSGDEWRLLHAGEEPSEEDIALAQLTNEPAGVLVEQGFMRLQEMASQALRSQPEATVIQTGEGAGREQRLKVPYLPIGIESNAVYNTIPELFTGRVDSSQNHWDRPDFFRTVAKAGLLLENIKLGEIPSTGGRMTSIAVTGYSFIPEKQCIEVITEDERTFQLDTRCYRSEFAGIYTDQRRPMQYTDKIHVTVNAQNNIDKILNFYLVPPNKEA